MPSCSSHIELIFTFCRYNPYVQALGRIDQLKRLGHSVDKVNFRLSHLLLDYLSNWCPLIMLHETNVSDSVPVIVIFIVMQFVGTGSFGIVLGMSRHALSVMDFLD